MTDALFIFNPAADRGHAVQNARSLRMFVDGLGSADWVVTESSGHAMHMAGQAAREGYETVVALGGDGTAHEVINGLMSISDSERPTLGIVPVGSGNDLAFNSGVAMDSLVAIERSLSGTLGSLDVGVITDGAGRTRYFGNVAGMFFDAASLIQSKRITRLHGFIMYLTAVIRTIIENYDTIQIDLTIDGKSQALDLLMLTLGNGAREGGGFMVTPDARNDDGVLDYLMVTSISRLMMIRLLPEVMRGAHARFACVSLGKFRSLHLQADQAVPIQLDGELWASYKDDVQQLSVEVLPGALRMRR